MTVFEDPTILTEDRVVIKGIESGTFYSTYNIELWETYTEQERDEEFERVREGLGRLSIKEGLEISEASIREIVEVG